MAVVQLAEVQNSKPLDERPAFEFQRLAYL
jgi:hypothetical protein